MLLLGFSGEGADDDEEVRGKGVVFVSEFFVEAGGGIGGSGERLISAVVAVAVVIVVIFVWVATEIFGCVGEEA
jgi:hypothetical protein